MALFWGVMIVAGIILIVVIVACWFPKVFEGGKAKEEKRLKSIAFYDECINEGIHLCDNPKEIQKATLIAQRMNLEYKDITELFIKAKQLKENMEQQKKEEEMAREEEREKAKDEILYTQLTRYAKYVGREKRIAMLSTVCEKYKESAETLESFSQAVWSASQLREEESNWAVWGGIASAIAGPAAGMATALDIQAKTARKNAEIRAQNEKNKEVFASAINTSYMSAIEKRSMVQKAEDEIEKAKLKLVGDEPKEKCFERLKFNKTQISVTKSGSCIIDTTVSVKPFSIYDDVSAVVDGTIIAQVYDGDNMIGEAEMVFPVFGVGKDAKLTGISLFCGCSDDSSLYTVKFLPEHLWTMER